MGNPQVQKEALTVVSPLAETLVRDARICKGRQDSLLLPEHGEIQDEVRDVRFHARGKPR